ncbi:MAG: SpoIID/LytB domain-containing protein [Planctomycetes bacterium]|nr:SpoIID/LytB domain-containing protein [Planctomycetota bacterium]
MTVKPKALLLLACVVGISCGSSSPRLALGQQHEALAEGKSRHRSLCLDGASPELKTLLQNYEIADKEFPWTLTFRREKEKWIEYDLTFPSPVNTDVEENNTVWCKFWEPKDDQKRRPAVVMLHWLGGSFEVLEIVCQRMAERGIATVMLWMPHYGKRRSKDPAKRVKMITLDNDRTVANFRQAVLDVRRAGDWLASRKTVEPSRVGIVGISLGAVVGALTAGIDLNFRRACFIVGGGDLPMVVMHGSSETASIKKKARELGLSQEKLTELWRGIEPLTYASRMDPATVLMINGDQDQVFPRASTEKLWEAVGKPSIVWYKADHFTWVLHLSKVLDQIESHMKKRIAYAGLPMPRLAAPTIRVLLKEDAEAVDVEIPGACDVRRPGGGSLLGKAVRIGAAKATANRGVSLGGRDWGEPWIVLEPKEPFRVGDRVYEGALHLIASRAGGLHVVNEVDLERYVAGVVGPEIGPGAPAEALKTQAVCARTYAYATWRETAHSAMRQIFDVYDDVRDQVYRGMPEPGSNVETAVRATAGCILTYEGKPFKAFFSSTCGGSTENGADAFGVDLPPLAGGKCGACGHARHFSWSLRLSRRELSEALKGPAGAGVADVFVAAWTRGGRAARVGIRRADGAEVLIPASEFRKTIGYDRFRSTRFTVAREEEMFVFSGNGWGHGVGLCQEGAIGRARSGDDWETILRVYYPSARIDRAY